MAKAFKTDESNSWEDFPFAEPTKDVISDLTDVEWLSPDFDEACDLFNADYPGEHIKSVKWINRGAKRVSVNGVNYTLYTEYKDTDECC